MMADHRACLITRQKAARTLIKSIIPRPQVLPAQHFGQGKVGVRGGMEPRGQEPAQVVQIIELQGTDQGGHGPGHDSRSQPGAGTRFL